MKWGRGIDEALGEKFVKMYVSELTIDMGEPGRKSLEYLFQRAHQKGLIPKPPKISLY